MYNLGAKIAELRKEKAMTQNDLADVLGVSSQAVSKWEIGASYPDISLIPKISKLLETSADYLLNDELEPAVKLQNIPEKKDTVNLYLSKSMKLAEIKLRLQFKTIKILGIDIYLPKIFLC